MDQESMAGGMGGAADDETTGAGDDRGRFDRLRDGVRDGYGRVREQVEDVDFEEVTEQVRTYVRSNPGKALLFSIGIGFALGLLLRSDDDD